MAIPLDYAPIPPSRRIRVTQYDDGIGIRFAQPWWRAALSVLDEFGLEGCLLLLLAPLFIFGAIFWATTGGISFNAILFVLIGTCVVCVAFVRQVTHEAGPELAVRAGRVTYRETSHAGVQRDCDVSDVATVLAGEGRPVVRTRGGNELLGGYDEIEVPGYRELNAAAKQWVAQRLRAAIGLPASQLEQANA